MVHLGLPAFGPPHQWLEEGLATYVEPVARARAGVISADRVWTEWMRDAPQGQPSPGDEGLEKAHTWGRTYWGGAVFCLAADVGIRRRTAGVRSLDDALRAVARESAGVAERWSVDRFLAVGDHATGTTVLHELYDRLALRPGAIDLEALWSELGVVRSGDAVSFDDRAPLSGVRRAITAR
jgi:predicted metalloprotease with PDZ domain